MFAFMSKKKAKYERCVWGLDVFVSDVSDFAALDNRF